MRKFTKEEYDLYKRISSMTQEQLKVALIATLNKFGYKYKVVEDGGIIAYGDIPICLVAHLDTVHCAPPCNFYYDREEGVVWSPDGLGADDRAGIYIILALIKKGYRPHILFCLNEEVGGRGAAIFAAEPCYFDDVRYFIELDRQGMDDCVFYWCDNKDFTSYIESFGFLTQKGLFSDISVLCPSWKIAGVNLSVGYFDEHSLAEHLFVPSLFDTMEKVSIMLENPPDNMYLYIPAEAPVRSQKCSCCGQPGAEYQFDNYYICETCVIEERIKWCSLCETIFIPKNPEQEFCDKCLEEFLF